VQLSDGLRLCEAHSYRVLAWPGLFLQVLLAAARGDDATTRALTDEMTAWGAPRRMGSVQAYAAHARALASLGRGEFENAYRHAAAVSPAGELASHVPHALWLIMDLTEAAVRSGRHAEAASHVAAAREAGVEAISPRLALITGASAAIASPDNAAGALFEGALAIPGADRWPFDLARIQLVYGERLRRAKTTTDARTHLSAAVDAFQRLGAGPWATRAANELRGPRPLHRAGRPVPSSLRNWRTSRTARAVSSGVYRRVVGLPSVGSSPMTPSSFPRSGASSEPRAIQLTRPRGACGWRRWRAVASPGRLRSVRAWPTAGSPRWPPRRPSSRPPRCRGANTAVCAIRRATYSAKLGAFSMTRCGGAAS
jgi:hypothetical protein